MAPATELLPGEGGDLYAVLGLGPRASREQVERAYRFCLELFGMGLQALTCGCPIHSRYISIVRCLRGPPPFSFRRVVARSASLGSVIDHMVPAVLCR